MSWCRPECALALMGICGWEGEGNRSILPQKNCCQNWWKMVNSVATEWFHPPARRLSGLLGARHWGLAEVELQRLHHQGQVSPIHPISIHWSCSKYLISTRNVFPKHLVLPMWWLTLKDVFKPKRLSVYRIPERLRPEPKPPDPRNVG